MSPLRLFHGVHPPSPNRRAPRPRTVRPRVQVLEGRVLPSIFTVTNTDDSGPGSLRQAILDANAEPGTDTIAFDIPGGGVQTIQPASALPTITSPVVIDGTTQPGFAGSPLIVLNGSLAGAAASGLTITAGYSTVQALVIDGFGGDGIDLLTSGSDRIAGCFIGTDAAGAQAVFNGGDGISIRSSNNLIGGTASAVRNLISGNRMNGGSISGGSTSGNAIEGNFIGTDVGGTLLVFNAASGVAISAGSHDNVVGGTAPGAGNLLSGNSLGVLISDAPANVVGGNLIGTDSSGSRALANGSGVAIAGEGSSGNLVGGTASGARNVISGNADIGVYVLENAHGNTIQGNLIGTDRSGSFPLSNQAGVYLSFADDNLVGGASAGAGNLISGDGYCLANLFIGAGTGNRIQGNRIGTDASGTRGLGSLSGIWLADTSDNLIGGTAAGTGNLISGHTFSGLYLFENDSNNLVQGNYIGTDITGTRALGNGYGGGIYFGSTDSHDNTFGGTQLGAGNLISGNSPSTGVTLVGAGNRLEGNYIGTDRTGRVALPNAGGVAVNGVDVTIGGTAPGAGNLISGNAFFGLGLSGAGTQGVAVQGNHIGTDISGTLALGNDGEGVIITGAAHDNLIGGSAAAAMNTIAFNHNDGVLVDTGAGNAIRRNVIFGHDSGLGIELVNGGNNGQPFPDLTSATSDATSTTVEGTLTSAPSTTFTVEFFADSVCNPSGYGEGERFLGSTTVTTDPSGQGAFTFTVAIPVDPGQFVAATATDPAGNTSQFSACAQVTGVGASLLGLATSARPSDPATPPEPISASPSMPLLTPALNLQSQDAFFTAIPGPTTVPSNPHLSAALSAPEIEGLGQYNNADPAGGGGGLSPLGEAATWAW